MLCRMKTVSKEARRSPGNETGGSVWRAAGREGAFSVPALCGSEMPVIFLQTAHLEASEFQFVRETFQSGGHTRHRGGDRDSGGKGAGTHEDFVGHCLRAVFAGVDDPLDPVVLNQIQQIRASP